MTNESRNLSEILEDIGVIWEQVYEDEVMIAPQEILDDYTKNPLLGWLKADLIVDSIKSTIAASEALFATAARSLTKEAEHWETRSASAETEYESHLTDLLGGARRESAEKWQSEATKLTRLKKGFEKLEAELRAAMPEPKDGPSKKIDGLGL